MPIVALESEKLKSTQWMVSPQTIPDELAHLTPRVCRQSTHTSGPLQLRAFRAPCSRVLYGPLECATY